MPNQRSSLRTCVVCRKKVLKQELLRFVSNNVGQLLCDKNYKLPGRGAYLHFKCVSKNSGSKLIYSLKKDLKDYNLSGLDIKKLVGKDLFSKKANHIKSNFR